jgi:AcrR family transcriptional regulator
MKKKAAVATDMDQAPARPRLGAPPRGEPSARERILTTASELFYREGIRAIGVDTVAERSGVSKTSLYRVFASKDELIAAFATEQDRLYWAWWTHVEERFPVDPQAQLSALLGGIAKRIRRADFRGCPFINLATEFPEPNHPGRAVALANKKEMRRRLTVLAARIGAHDPARAADQIALLIDGAYSFSVIAESTGIEQKLVGGAFALIRQKPEAG